MIRPNPALLLALWFLVAVPRPAVAAELVLPSVISDGMVIQRDVPVPLWGFASPRQTVTVVLDDRRLEVGTTADPGGRWKLELPPLPAGGPHTLVIHSGDQVRVIEDVLVGEVWLASGQSNMQWRVVNSDDAPREIASADLPRVRVFRTKLVTADEPGFDFGGEWVATTPATVGDHTAVGYFFARKLHEELGVPVGVLQSAWGGTPAEAWTPMQDLKVNALTRPRVERYEQGAIPPDEYQRLQERHRRLVAGGKIKERHDDVDDTALRDGYADPGLDDADWAPVGIDYWENQGLYHDGVAWYRSRVRVPEAWVGRPLVLSLGRIDDYDHAFVNGTPVGHTGQDQPNAPAFERRYDVPAEAVTEPGLTIAVRVFDPRGRGGMYGPASLLRLENPADPGNTVPLTDGWRIHFSAPMDPLEVSPNPPPRNPAWGNTAHAPAVLYNGMIAPLAPYRIAGAIWYQGESNAGRAHQYEALFPLMIRAWRREWRQGDFPFYFVQLANYMRDDGPVADPPWAHLREAQRLTLDAEPNTGMAVAIDIGDPNDIHPRDKQAVADRLARLALHDIYGRDEVVRSGPLYAGVDYEADGDGVLVRFTQTGEGLAVRDGDDTPLGGFTVAGNDRVFHVARAVILDDGQTVHVRCDQVHKPVAVRYGWKNDPSEANLVNTAGLPASPFRSDRWPHPTDDER